MKVCKGGPFLQFHETEADSESSEKLIGSHWSLVISICAFRVLVGNKADLNENRKAGGWESGKSAQEEVGFHFHDGILKVTKEEGQKLATQYNMKFFEAPNETKTPARCWIRILDVIGALLESQASEFF